jgi:hypothetical protein
MKFPRNFANNFRGHTNYGGWGQQPVVDALKQYKTCRTYHLQVEHPVMYRQSLLQVGSTVASYSGVLQLKSSHIVCCLRIGAILPCF